jgi:hypothetical protein
VLAREYQDALLFGAVHQLTVDTYAAQHPVDQPAKSLVSHLVSLHTIVAEGSDQVAGRNALLRFVSGRKEFPALSPPTELGPLTVLDVANAESFDAHVDVVRRWARQIWDAWFHHHDLIASLARSGDKR